MKRRIRIISLSMLCCFLYQLVFPVAAYALTGGPSQPEVESFEPVGTSEMVDLFSGDFNYNIPLMDVDGYPINIAYHSGVTMDQEASWVGLGWNLNPGVINRNMRGLPDDFKGDAVNKVQYIKPDRTYGANLGTTLELFGKEGLAQKGLSKIMGLMHAKASLSLSMGISYNNYRGLGIETRVSPAIDAGSNLKTPLLKQIGFNARLDIASSNQDGFSIKPSVGISSFLADNNGYGFGPRVSVGMAVSSRGGVKSLTCQASISPGYLKAVDKEIAVKGENGEDKTEKVKDYKEKSRKVAQLNSTISYGMQTYTPAISMQMENINLSLTGKLGVEFMGIDPGASITGYYASQYVAETHSQRAAIGVLYAQDFDKYNDAMMDFNREKEGSISNKNPILALPVFTYDIYSASGQGMAGMFKPYRNDLPVVHDPLMRNSSSGVNLSVELSTFNTLKMGLNPIVNHTEVKAGGWEKDNDLLKKFYYSSKSLDDPFREPVYFKSVGEKGAVDTSMLAYHEISYPVRPVMGEIAPALSSKDVFLKSDKLEKRIGSGHAETTIQTISPTRNGRDKRNQLFSYLTVAEKDYCLEQELGFNDDNSPIAREDANRKDHHLTEITVSNDQGSRYVYGLPVYNTNQYDISFTNAQDPDGGGSPAHDCGTGQVVYDSGIDFGNLPKSQFESRSYKGNDHAMSITQTPPYAHSYLLTAVLSPDYVDVTGDGPDRGDYGNYTKLSYQKASGNYHWRIPYNQYKANYSEGLKSDPTDDNANIMYGEKEVWLVKQIEGKNHYAKFILSEREDALGVTDIHGGKDLSQRSYKLDRIELYSFNDISVPIKTVHFEYSYELCDSVDNNSGTSVNKDGQTPAGGEENVNANKGKLTLKKIYFTYGKSSRGRFNAYTFVYSPENNYSYNIKSYDRWGNYKPNNCSSEIASSVEYPYVDQDSSVTNPRIAAWSLSSITLPSGGIINIEYESDDYAYVQNRRAMQMAKIKGFADYDDNQTNLNNPLSTFASISGVSGELYDGKNPRECILFDLPASMKYKDPALIKQYLLESTGNLLYYNCLVNLGSQNKNEHYNEYVRGYTQVSAAGVIDMGGANPVGWIEVTNQDNNQSNPISKTAWQYARMYLPYLVYPGSNLRKKADKADVAEIMIRGMFGFMYDVIGMIEGVNNKLRSANYGKNVDLNNSWIRVNNMTGKKLGGGSRVKRLTISDNWMALSGSDKNMSYGQEYSYDIKEQYNGEEQVISSGVASYEPSIGSDENPFKMPVAYSSDNIGVPNDEFYTEEPFGESWFPAPLVGYSRVSVKNIVPSNVQRHGTGKVVHQFYTARDFPVFTSHTDIAPKHYQKSGIFKLVGFVGEDHVAMTQGFQVELNDMHGKPKAVLNYTQANIDSYEDKEAFSGIKYDYNIEDENNPVKKLSTRFQVIDNNNQVSTQHIGLESEMVLDTRSHSSKTYSGGMELNLDGFIFPFGFIPIPIIVPDGWPNFSSEITDYRSGVIMRVVNRFGILKRTTAFEEGSSVATENILLDAETGGTLLTRTYNEYNDPVYNMTMPAHWVYDGMGQGYKNIGAEVEVRNVPDSGNVFKAKVNGQIVDASNYFADGDEIVVSQYPADGATLYSVSKRWVMVKNGSYYMIDKEGYTTSVATLFNYRCYAKIIRSGRRNMQNIPVMQFTSLENPWTSDSLLLNTNTKIVQASAAAFSDQWRTPKVIRNPYEYALLYQVQMMEIFNFLLQSGLLTKTLAGETKVNISSSTPGSDVYFNSDIRRFIVERNLSDSFKVIRGNIISEDWNMHDWGFQMGDGVNFAGELINARIRPDTSWTPLSIDFNSMVDGQNALAKLTYLDAGSVKKDTVLNVAFGHVNTQPLYTCDDLFPIVNPYLESIKGNWRKQKDWVYYDARTPQSIASGSTTNIRKDGTYNSFTPFFAKNSSGTTKWTETDPKGKWTQTNEVTRYSLAGNETENKDAIGRYSSVVYGFNNILPVAVANNAKYKQIGFDGCEELILFGHQCPMIHLDFGLKGLSQVIVIGGIPTIVNKYSPLKSHTGNQSYELSQHDTLYANHTIYVDTGISNSKTYYSLRPGDLIGLFNPEAGKYVVGAWVKVGNDPKRTTYNNTADTTKSCRIEIDLPGFPSTVRYYARPSGPIIEGWQRIEKVFDIPVSATSIKISLIAADESDTKTWFDDMRVHPFDARMKSYVYDPATLRLTAELDENNYATFYEYDAEGQLVHVKRETEKGIVTVKAMRSHQYKSGN